MSYTLESSSLKRESRAEPMRESAAIPLASRLRATRKHSLAMDDDDPQLPPALAFLRDIWALNHAIEKTSMRMESALGVTAQQRMILRIVGRFPEITAGRLARMLHVDAGTVSTALRRMEARGLILRRQDPKDRRRVSLRLAAAGRRLDVATQGTVESAVETLLSQTEPNERETVRNVLARLALALSEEPDETLGSSAEDA